MTDLERPGSRAWFENYIQAFNEKAYDRFTSYYAEDVQFIGQAATLNGKAELVRFFRMADERLNERLELSSFAGGSDVAAAELVTTLDFKADWPDFIPGPMKAGDLRKVISFAFYDTVDGKFVRIRTARYAVLRER